MFSEVVDTVILRSGRPDKKADIIDWTNATIRESQTIALFPKDRVEAQFQATSCPFIWPIPRNMRNLEAVKYGVDTYPDYIKPGKLQSMKTTGQYYYAASTYYVFSGVGNPNDTYVDPVTGIGDNTISVAYFTHLQKLSYYAVGTRPAVLNEDTDIWTFLDGTQVPFTGPFTDAQETAINQVYNWLLGQYTDMIKEGVLSKVFKSVKDNERAATSYSLYKQFQQGLLQNEGVEALNQFGSSSL